MTHIISIPQSDVKKFGQLEGEIMHPTVKYEKLTTKELVLLNKIIGEQAREQEDDVLFEIWKDIATALSCRNEF